MMKHLIIITIFLLALNCLYIKGDLLDCDETLLSSFAGIGPKLESSELETTREKFGDFLKKWGCQIKRSAAKFGENMKEGAIKFGENFKQRAKAFKEQAKEFGTKIQAKFNDFKDHLSKDFDESLEIKPKFYEEQNIEIIDPDLLKSNQMCGHGHILDALGNCSKLRK